MWRHLGPHNPATGTIPAGICWCPPPNGIYGSQDGTGVAATFAAPLGVATDNAGNIYVADTSNNIIRKITADGLVTTLAGTAGAIGSADGTGRTASFSFPCGVAVDSAGNVYVSDGENDTIRKITAAGVVSTLAGNASSFIRFTDGQGSAAHFLGPAGLAVVASNNVYVADQGNQAVRKITPTGLVNTLYSAPVGGFSPIGIALDGAGNIYVGDVQGRTVSKITPAGVVDLIRDFLTECVSRKIRGYSAKPRPESNIGLR